MRPLRLVLEGFTCFKEKQPPLDFSALSLFAISGPTGAGKSSLLDAMIYALYGKVPRLRKTYTELISLGRDRMSVVFDFHVGRRDLRISRVARRGRAAEAQLEELTGGREKPVADGVQSVDQEVEKILGLGYDAFTQAVVLPQGEFARFLKSRPHERREILRDLLRLQVYERMREHAAQTSRELGSRAQHLESMFAEHYAGATDELLSSTTAEADALALEVASARARSTADAESLDQSKKKAGLTRELREKRDRATRLAAEAPDMKALIERRDAATRVLPVVPLIELSTSALAESRAAQEEARRAGKEVERAQKAHAAAQKKREAALRSAGAVPGIKAALRALDEAVGWLAPREEAQKSLAEAQSEERRLEQERERAREEERRSRDRMKAKEKAWGRAEEKMRSLRYDEDRAQLLDAVRDRAAVLSHDRQSAAELQMEVEAAAGRARAEREAGATRELEAKEATARHDELSRKLAQVEHEEVAFALRSTLRVGETCSVCGQSVKKLPGPAQRSLLDTFFQEVTAARREAEAKNRAAAHARAAADAAEASAEAARKKAEAAARRVLDGERDLEARVGLEVKAEPGMTIEERVLTAVKRLAESRAQWVEARNAREDVEKAYRETERDAAEKQATVGQLGERRDRAGADAEKLAGELARLEKRIRSVAKDGDPIAERERLASEQENLEQGLKRSEAEVHGAATGLAVAENASETAARARAESLRRARDASERARSAAQDAGFSSEDEAQKSALSSEALRQIESQVRSYLEDKASTDGRIAELEAELGGLEVDDRALSKAEAAARASRDRYEDGLKREATLKQQVKQLKEQIRAARKLSAELQREREAHRLYRELEEDLRSNRFQSYLLEETFGELVSGASQRLLSLSSRYALEFREDLFYVLDHENAGERRLADTLSGGETFLASLALALELSEQVQKAAGAVNLDSLFIDEGFGTLDPETLDTVAAAIEMLPLGGRMVGIITHLPELTARLPARILVEKRAEGSRVREEIG